MTIKKFTILETCAHVVCACFLFITSIKSKSNRSRSVPQQIAKTNVLIGKNCTIDKWATNFVKLHVLRIAAPETLLSFISAAFCDTKHNKFYRKYIWFTNKWKRWRFFHDWQQIQKIWYRSVEIKGMLKCNIKWTEYLHMYTWKSNTYDIIREMFVDL